MQSSTFGFIFPADFPHSTLYTPFHSKFPHGPFCIPHFTGTLKITAILCILVSY